MTVAPVGLDRTGLDGEGQNIDALGALQRQGPLTCAPSAEKVPMLKWPSCVGEDLPDH